MYKPVKKNIKWKKNEKIPTSRSFLATRRTGYTFFFLPKGGLTVLYTSFSQIILLLPQESSTKLKVKAMDLFVNFYKVQN